jgi:aryl-alcohol dehydrogenase-like predicted oxidoreductase
VPEATSRGRTTTFVNRDITRALAHVSTLRSVSRVKTPVTATATVPLLVGRATAKATMRHAERFAKRRGAEFHRPLDRMLRVSTLGLGTYLGECDDADDDRYDAAARAAFERGVNILDSAINYRCQRSERVVGRAVRASVGGGLVTREEVVLCTKGGYIPLDTSAPASREEYHALLEREYFASGIVSPEDVIADAHSIAPGFLADQLRRSRENMGVETIDVYYVHNPEQQLDVIKPAQLLDRLRETFAMLESRCDAGDIARYGCATWNGFRAARGTRGHLELAEVVAAAHDVGGPDHRFRVVQLPINLAMPEAVRVPTQRVRGREMPFLHAAAELGISVVASASLLQARLATGLPPQVREALPGFSTDAQRALSFVTSLPVSTALVGMRSIAHLDENLAAFGE